MSECSVDVVLFDFGGVIADEGFVNGLAAIAEMNDRDPESIIKAGFDVVHRTEYVLGQSDEKTFWQTLREETGITGSDEALRDQIFSRFTLRKWMFEVIKSLRLSGVRVGILSDQTDWLDELDARYDFFKQFDYVFCSYHLGKSKRDETLFDEIIRRVDAEAHRILFVDDFQENCDRARSRGINAILYTDGERFLTELENYCAPAVTQEHYNTFI
ncbi:MAG: HAD family phosphatase [Deltaproteobacteria bacterium]|nr:HAD family phosphatase [Deltaproteobacteria bacterium]